MDFRRIQHFVRVAEVGNLSKAAERLNIVQPALSQSIKRLEKELGVLLFTRTRRGMDLTDSGQTFLKHAYGILNQYHRAKESLSTKEGTPKGLVSIAMTASSLEVLALPLAASLVNDYPDIKLNIESGLAGNIRQGFDAGHYDLVLSHLVKPDATIRIESLIKEDLFLVTPYDADSLGEDIAFKALDGLTIILPHDQHGVAPDVDRYAAEKEVKLITGQVVGALRTTLQLIEAGMGNSLLPWSAIRERVEQNKISARKVIGPSLHHTVSMVHPTHRPLTPATIAVMALIRQAAKDVYNEGKWAGTLLLPEESTI